MIISVGGNTGDGQTLESDVTESIYHLIHNTIVLAVHALGSGATLATLVNDSTGAISVFNLNLVERGVVHGVFP